MKNKKQKTNKINKPDYEKGFFILLEYFDSISEEERPNVDRRLKRCGL